MDTNDIQQEVIGECKLYKLNLVNNGVVFVEIRKSLFVLKKSGALANKQLSKLLDNEGYFQLEHTPGLWLQKIREGERSFTLVVDDFAVNYTKKKDVLYLQYIVEKAYPTTTDWTGN